MHVLLTTCIPATHIATNSAAAVVAAAAASALFENFLFSVVRADN